MKHLSPFHLVLPAVVAMSGAAAAAPLPGDGECVAAAVLEQEINVSSGIYTERAVATVPMKIRVPTGTDASLESECLRVAGRGPTAATTAEFERADRCRAQARRVHLARPAAGTDTRLGSSFDEDAYRACLRGDIQVEVLDGD